ncbi:hypothetical protein DDZ14_11510 [Maritimibacter sp. 55A14]|nr:hypothetical protein DDZ14_11510 [Maritimibacter sp. 55A14]
MKVEHIAAFSSGELGSNPAGVVICDELPEPTAMQKVAADVGYSESVFAASVGDAWRVRTAKRVLFPDPPPLADMCTSTVSPATISTCSTAGALSLVFWRCPDGSATTEARKGLPSNK